MTEVERTVILPPVVLESYEEFCDMARGATVLTYNPEYLRSPFLDDMKRLRRVTLYAVGVMMNKIPMTFKYVLNYYDLPPDSRDADEVLSDIIASIQSDGVAIRGAIDSDQSAWDPHAIRP